MKEGSAPHDAWAATTNALLAERIGRDSPGYVAGVCDATGTRLVAAGRSNAADGRPLDGAAVFEVGSVTKVFTALLLADMAARGEVALSDRVADHLPPEGRPWTVGERPITLIDLATHTSGLPRLPGNLEPRNPADPYADYTAAQLHQALSAETPAFSPGTRYEYSNLGYGLLGHALARRAGRSFEDLLVSRICGPLGLHDTRITPTADMRRRLVPGHDAALAPVPGWHWQVLAGAGALHSTANDLLRFMGSCLGRPATLLSPAIASLPDVRRPSDMQGVTAAMGWFVLGTSGEELVWKNGGTFGTSSVIAYCPGTGRAAVLLANSFSLAATTQLGLHVLDSRIPLLPPAP